MLMNPPLSISSDQRRDWVLIALVWIPAVMFLYLLAMQPYSSGYL